MHANEKLIHDFYQAFQRRDGAAMAACYHPDATFSDPVFQGLRGREPGAMWRMLCERGKDLKLEYSDVSANDSTGEAKWVAWYTFGATGRKVENRIQARFKFKDGKILEHVDDFAFWRWTRMALGLPGVLLGWTPLIQGKVRKMARKGLSEYMAAAGATTKR
jgi:ketosteroid isomerase-like protein